MPMHDGYDYTVPGTLDTGEHAQARTIGQGARQSAPNGEQWCMS